MNKNEPDPQVTDPRVAAEIIKWEMEVLSRQYREVLDEIEKNRQKRLKRKEKSDDH